MQSAETAQSQGAGIAEAQGQTALAKADFSARVSQFAGAHYERIMSEQRQAAHQAAMLDVNNRLSDWKNDRLYDPEHGAFTRKGKDAMGLPEELHADFVKFSGGLEASLSTPEQKAAFARLQGEEWSNIDTTVRRHVLGEAQQYHAGELKATVDNGIDSAIKNALDPKMVQADLTKVVSAIKTSAKSLGLGPEQVDAQVAAAQSATHVGVIANLLSLEKDQEASSYYAAVKGQVAGDKQDQVQKALDEGTARGQGFKQADQIIAAGGTLTEQRDKAKQIDNPKVREIVEQRIEHESAVKDRADKETEVENSRRGFDILDRTPDVTRIPPALWTSYDGGTRSAMMSYATRRAKGEPIETDQEVFYKLISQAGDAPEAFVKENLLRSRARLNDSDFQQLASLQLSIKNGNSKLAEKTLQPYNVDTAIMDDALTLYGIDPKDKNKGPQIAQLRSMLRARGSFLESATGKPASNADITAAANDILSKTLTKPGWFGTSVGAKTPPLLDATIKDVPAGFKVRHPGLSDAALLNAWIEAQVNLSRLK